MNGLVIWLVLVPFGAVPEVTPPTAEQARFFEMRVRPLLVERCQKCHGAKKQWGNLRLDSREAILNGGDSGPAMVPGQPDQSLMMRAVARTDEGLQMPPDEELSAAQILVLNQWIAMGAPFSPTEAAADVRTRDPNHWAFQPPNRVAVPLTTSTWPKTEIDQFVLAKLEIAGLSPTPTANKRTLIRRASFGLTGLPPTPNEVDAFLLDRDPNAFAHLVDRLLESPAYGERWGRHWLDVARYADSNGLDENVAQGNAWRYRDYVVAAFNSDKPYDRFILEQLAGDLLPATDEAQRHEQLVATGFLVLGAKVLAEVDQDKMQMDIVDEQIDTVGRAIMGLTLGCARCHDHKFDPISTEDYYGLAGVFKSTRTMETLTSVARWYEHPLHTEAQKIEQKQYETELATLQTSIDAFKAQASQEIQQRLGQAASTSEDLESQYSEDVKAELKKLRDSLAERKKNPPNLPSTMGVTEGGIADVPVHVRGNPQKLGEVVVRHVLPVVQGPTTPTFSAKESGRRELAQWLVDPHHPLTGRVIVNRVWRWHFGTGLVLTPDNFGVQGEAATHPELLDWLAQWLIDHHWSIKALHRLILNSSTYQQSSGASSDILARDPQNRFYGRSPMRRLEAEELRDALLMASGQLDPTMGGSLLQIKNREYVFDHTSRDLTDYRSPRRSIYLPVIRNNPLDVLQLYDFPDATSSNGNRSTTTTAPQSLVMLNSDFVLQAADGLMARVYTEPGSDADRLRRIYSLAYAREPTDIEREENLRFLDRINHSLTEGISNQAERHRQAWSILCQVILGSNEFIYVE